MRKLGKKQQAALIDRQIQAAVVGLQIPIMAIPAIYREGERLLAEKSVATREEFVAQFQAFAIEKGAVRV